MARTKTLLTLFGLGALGFGAFEASHSLPHLIDTYRAALSPSTSVAVQTAKWSPGQAISKSGLSTPESTTSPSNPTSTVVSSGETANSYNWAGIVQNGRKEKSVQATWTAPRFATTPSNPNSSVAEWIGLGGMSASNLIQVGTITTPNSQGQAVTSVFWEELPHSAVQTATIATGSVVTAKIEPVQSDTWRLTLSVKGQSKPLINKVLTLTPNQAASIESSADWITEAPTTNHGVSPLAPVATTTMTHVKANGVPLNKMNSASLQSVGLYSQAGALLAEPVSTRGKNAITVDTAYGSSLPGGNATPGSISQSGGGTWVIETTPVNGGGTGGSSYGDGGGYGGGYGYSGSTGYGGGYGYSGSVGYGNGYGYGGSTGYGYSGSASYGGGYGYSGSIGYSNGYGDGYDNGTFSSGYGYGSGY